MENKRELLKAAIENNEGLSRLPIGFWHHFVLGADQFRGLEEPEILERVVQGHIDYYDKVNPDMMKLMNEGFFGYPPIMDKKFDSEEDLLAIKAVGANHPWIVNQVEHVKRLTDLFSPEVMTFYNIFAPLQMIRIRFDFLDLQYNKFVELAERYPDALHQAGMEIQKDIIILIEKLLTETKLDGVYYCVQNIQSERYDKAQYNKVIRPTEIEALQIANQLSEYNILHICGYAGHYNDLTLYQDYEARIYNWAIHTEKVSIEEGRKLFPGKCILGGFDNNPNTLIDKGSKEELEAYVQKLARENGNKGYIIGADCSIPNDIDDQQVRNISDIVHELKMED